MRSAPTISSSRRRLRGSTPSRRSRPGCWAPWREPSRASVRAGTGLADVGAPLWDAGLSLANQGDVDAQTVSEAIATGTKGSGLQFGSLSSTVCGVRLVNGQGDIITITEDEPDLLHAAQVQCVGNS